MIKEAYTLGVEQAIAETGMTFESDLEKTAFIWRGAKAIGRGIGWAGRQAGLWGQKKTPSKCPPTRSSRVRIF